MKLNSIFLTTAACVIATSAFAETNYLEGHLSYSQLDYDFGPELDLLEIGGAYEGSTNGFSYGLDLNNMNLSDNGFSEDITAANLFVGYEVMPSLTIVGGAMYVSIFDEDLKSYGLGLEYAYHDYTFGLGGIQFDFGDETEEDFYAFAEYSNGPYTANIGYTGAAGTDIWLLGVEYETDLFEVEFDALDLGGDADFTIVDLEGKYYIQDKFRVIAGIGSVSLGSSDLTTYKIGGGYEIMDNLWLDATYGGTSFEGDEVLNELAIGVTFETGKRKLRTRENVFNFGEFYSNFILFAS